MSTVTRVIRTLGSGRTHVADVHPGQIGMWHFASDFTGVKLPVATRCGAILRCRTGVAVCMKAGTRVVCPRCRRITGIVEAVADNQEMVTVMSTDDIDDAVDSALTTGAIDGVEVDPAFRDLLCRVARGELKADDVMKIVRKKAN